VAVSTAHALARDPRRPAHRPVRRARLDDQDAPEYEALDLVTYGLRTAPVYATVGGSGGEAGEGDTIGADVEQIHGGAGPDVLRGGPGNDGLSGGDGGDDIDGGPGDDGVNGEQGPNRVAGGPGNDWVGADGTSTLLGGPGDDPLGSGPGNDLVDPGPGRDVTSSRGGADRLQVRDGEHDEVGCGPGASARADAHDLVLGCDRIDRDSAGHATLHLHRYITRPRRSYAVELLCSNDLRPRCAGRVRLTARGRRAGSARFAVAAGHTRTIVVALAAFARRALAYRGRLALAVRVDTRNEAGRRVVLPARAVERSRLW
jgi:RTX calcium-binding nonapeptide repeat (4 copies)